MAKQKIVKRTPGINHSVTLPLWERKHFLSAVTFLFSFILFANSILNNYNLDDELVTKNHRLTSKGISAIPEIFTSSYYQDQMGYSYEYRPLVLTSLAIEHQFFGDNAHVGHFFNVLLYALCCLLLLKVLRRLLQEYSPLIPFAITLLFAAHTAHTEIVCSIKNRDEILALLFSLLSLWAALNAVISHRKWQFVLIPVFFTLALMSKTSILSFVLIIPLALLFFTEIRIAALALVTLLLLLPTYFLFSLGDGFDKFKLIIALAATVVLFATIKNRKIIFQAIKKLFDFFLTSMRSLEPNKDLIGPASESFGDIFKGIIPDKKIFAPLPIITTLMLTVVYGVLIANAFSIAAFLPLVILFVLAWFGKGKLSWWANVFFSLCIASNSFFRFTDKEVYFAYTGLLSKYFALLIIFGRRDLFIPYFTSFFTIAFFEGYYHPDFVTLKDLKGLNMMEGVRTLFTLPLVVLLIKKRFRIAIMIGMTALLFFDAFQLIQGHALKNEFFYEYTLLAFLICIIAIHFQKGIKETGILFILPALILFQIGKNTSDRSLAAESRKLANNSLTTVINVANQNNPQISKPGNRPLQYMEQCVSMNDPLSLRIGTSLTILLHYLEKTIAPYPLSFYYGYRFIRPTMVSEPMPVVSFILYLLIFLSALMLTVRNKLISLGLFIYLFSIASFSNFFYFVPGMIADRFLLIPSLGWCMVFVGILRIFSGASGQTLKINWRAINPTVKYVFVSVLLFYSALTVVRNSQWKDDLTLFRHDIKYVSESSQANNLLALHLMQHAEEETDPILKTSLEREALTHFQNALKIYPQFFNVAYDIGRVYLTLNLPDSALNAFRHSIAIDTMYPEVYRNIGDIYIFKKMYPESAPYLEHVIRTYPSEYSSYGKLSYNYFLMKEYEKSVEVNKRAMLAIPNIPDPYINIYRTYSGSNQPDSAQAYLLKANKLFPNNREIIGLLNQSGYKHQ